MFWFIPPRKTHMGKSNKGEHRGSRPITTLRKGSPTLRAIRKTIEKAKKKGKAGLIKVTNPETNKIQVYKVE